MAKSRVTFGWESLEVLLQEPNTRELLTQYWSELSPIKHIPLDIDWPRLFEWERDGIYRIWAARVDGTLAGFVAFYVQPHVYYRAVLFAVDGGYFIAPAFRGSGRVGFRLWSTAKTALKAEGVRVVMAHDNAHRPLMPFFLSLGLEPISCMWVGVLDEGATIEW